MKPIDKPPLIERINPGLLMLIASVAGIILGIGGIYGAAWLLRTFPP